MAETNTNTPPNVASLIKATEISFSDKSQSLDFGTEAHFAMQAITAKNFTRDVALKNPNSLKSAMINVAAIGLSLNPANKDAYLVPRDGAIHLDISYTGLIKLATNTGSIKWVQAKIVFENDTFEDNGVGNKPTHTSNPFRDRGDAIGVYCVAKTLDGDYLVTTMDSDEIEAVRQTSKAATGNKPQYSPWSTFPQEMWKKVVIKRASKTWPKTDQNGAEVLQEAIHVLNEHEGNDFIPAASPEQLKEYEQFVAGDDALGIYCFYQSLEIEVQTSLSGQYVKKYAEKGGIGRLKETLKSLHNEGQSLAFDYRDALEDSVDDDEIKQLITEIDDNEYKYIHDLLSIEAQNKLTELAN